jgi:hypothetical protein
LFRDIRGDVTAVVIVAAVALLLVLDENEAGKEEDDEDVRVSSGPPLSLSPHSSMCTLASVPAYATSLVLTVMT